MKARSAYEEKFICSRLKEGDRDAFNFVFYTYYKGMVLYAKRILKDLDQAEDAVQGVFVKLWTNREKISIESSILSYLQRSVHNKCLDILKHEKVVKEHENSPHNHITERVDTGEDLILFAEIREKLEHSINNLPDNCKEIFKLSRFEGLKYTEIAERLQISVKTVEAGIGKALKILRSELHEDTR